MSFFGFDTTLPEHKGQQQQQPHQQQQQPKFATNDSTSFGGGFPQQEEDDLATFTWGEGASTNLLEGGDEMNDETFGDSGNGGMSLLPIRDEGVADGKDKISNGQLRHPLSQKVLSLVRNRDTDQRLFMILLLLLRTISILPGMIVSGRHLKTGKTC
jgi:hypothetical protein